MSAASGRPACCKQLLENDHQVMNDAVRVLISCANNILRSPTEPKFRRIPVANRKVQQCLLPACGAIECLFEMGFVEASDHFVLPPEAPLSKVKTIHDELVAISHELDNGPVNAVPTQDNRHGVNTVIPETQITAAFWQQKESEFLRAMKNGIACVEQYMRPELIEKARRYIPLQQLTASAKERCAQLNLGDRFLPDQLLILLLQWFKETFFRWMDTPSCGTCGADTQLVGTVPPLPEEITHLARNVESYSCKVGCGHVTRFPRYNDPGRLLETRVGRCGEWANCFTLVCIAAGLEARFVQDWSDHVWTEVFSTAQGRWLHADPCENICDEPLLYESGWGKKISYVIAYSTEDIQDVTWRYTSHPVDVLSRRTQCRENWLARTIVELRNNIHQERLRTNTITPARVMVSAERTVLELVELMTEQKPERGNLPGRTTGSEEWRRARGELGVVKSYTIVPTEREIERGVLELKYSCVRDEYTRVSDDSSVTSGWQSLLHETQSVFRKEERDWKMVYLARQEGSEVGKVVWQFDVGASQKDICIDRVEILVQSSCFETGRVQWILSDNTGSHSEVVSPGQRLISDSFSGCSDLRLSAELSGGNGRTAWQHAQLFRQSLQTDATEFPLEIVLRLRHKS